MPNKGPARSTQAKIRWRRPIIEYKLLLSDGTEPTIRGRSFSEACREAGLDPKETRQNIHSWKLDGRPQEGNLPELDKE